MPILSLWRILNLEATRCNGARAEKIAMEGKEGIVGECNKRESAESALALKICTDRRSKLLGTVPGRRCPA